MLRRIVGALLVMGALAAPALAPPARADDDQIDADLEACLDGEMTTQGMVECFGAAYEAWDSALNDVYGQLRASLADDEASALRDAQRAWIAFRDAEQGFLASLLKPDRGTMMRITVNAMMTDLVKARVLALRSLADGEEER